MSMVEPGSEMEGLVARARAILLQPTAEWRKIDLESGEATGLLTRYVLPLAALAAIAGLIGSLVFGYGAFGVSVRPSLTSAIISAVMQVVLALAMVFVLARVIDFLAVNFGATRDSDKAMRVAAYASTAGLAAGVFAIYPPLAILGLVGLYSIYLLHTGLRTVMKAPQDQAIGYTVAVILVAGIAGLLLAGLSTCVSGAVNLGGLAGGFGGVRDQAEVRLPDGANVKIGDLEAATKELERAAASIEGGQGAAPVAVESLKALLPQTLPGGFLRTEISTGSMGAAGFSGTTASAIYTRGEARLDVAVVDLGAAGALAGLAGTLSVQATTQNANGYERTFTEDGRMVIESLDRTAKTASYSTIVENRIALSVDGSNISEADVKSVIDAIDLKRLSQLAKAARARDGG